jgi:hypothetical protein
MGMDWHSSGMTTSVLSALKRGLEPVRWELGLHVCGGRGAASRKTPVELAAVGQRVGLDADRLAQTSRLVAKVDGAAVQDGYALYLHAFVAADDGRWAVVQQGMCDARREARRYHWLSDGLTSFVDAPHTAIEGRPHADPIVNLTDRRAADARASQLTLVREGPDAIGRAIAQHRSEWNALWRPRSVAADVQLPFHHDIRPDDVIGHRLHASIAAAHARAPVDFAELLLTPGVGACTVFALAMVGEVLHGTPARFSDPARFALAHGGKDGHPFPVPLRVYDATIRVLRRAIARARLGQDDKLAAIRRLDAEARRLESAAHSVDVNAVMDDARRHSAELGGRTATGSRGGQPVERASPVRARGVQKASTDATDTDSRDMQLGLGVFG